jgi:hypothetical protein
MMKASPPPRLRPQAPNCNRPSILPIKVGICAMDKKVGSDALVAQV